MEMVIKYERRMHGLYEELDDEYLVAEDTEKKNSKLVSYLEKFPSRQKHTLLMNDSLIAGITVTQPPAPVSRA